MSLILPSTNDKDKYHNFMKICRNVFLMRLDTETCSKHKMSIMRRRLGLKICSLHDQNDNIRPRPQK